MEVQYCSTVPIHALVDPNVSLQSGLSLTPPTNWESLITLHSLCYAGAVTIAVETTMGEGTTLEEEDITQEEGVITRGEEDITTTNQVLNINVDKFAFTHANLYVPKFLL